MASYFTFEDVKKCSSESETDLEAWLKDIATTCKQCKETKSEHANTSQVEPLQLFQKNRNQKMHIFTYSVVKMIFHR